MEKTAFVRSGIKRVYQRLSSSSHATPLPHLRVCYYRREGRCNRHPCRFLHAELADAPPLVAAAITKRRPDPTNRYTSGPPSVLGKRRDARPPVVAKTNDDAADASLPVAATIKKRRPAWTNPNTTDSPAELRKRRDARPPVVAKKNDNAADAPPPVAATIKERRPARTNPNTSDPPAELGKRRDASPPVAKTNGNAAAAPPLVADTITKQSLVWTNPNTSDSPAELENPREASSPVENANDDKIHGQFFAGNSTCGGVFSHLASLRGHKNVSLLSSISIFFSGKKNEF